MTSVAAQTAIAVFHVAFTRWVSTDHRETFLEQLHEARETLSTFAPLPPAEPATSIDRAPHSSPRPIATA